MKKKINIMVMFCLILLVSACKNEENFETNDILLIRNASSTARLYFARGIEKIEATRALSTASLDNPDF